MGQFGVLVLSHTGLYSLGLSADLWNSLVRSSSFVQGDGGPDTVEERDGSSAATQKQLDN